MERHFDDELEKFNIRLLHMATLTEEAIYNSIDALMARDKETARAVIEQDKRIDDLENEIEEQAIDLLALFQPMAKDLRFITTGLKFNTELERIADLAVNISQRAIELANQDALKPYIDLPKLAENTQKMVRNSIDAFIKRDENIARQVIIDDEISNDLRTKIFQELVNEYMVIDGKNAPRAVALLLITRDLERMSDHAAAIAEDVIYMIQAKVVKHHRDQILDG